MPSQHLVRVGAKARCKKAEKNFNKSEHFYNFHIYQTCQGMEL